MYHVIEVKSPVGIFLFKVLETLWMKSTLSYYQNKLFYWQPKTFIRDLRLCFRQHINSLIYTVLTLNVRKKSPKIQNWPWELGPKNSKPHSLHDILSETNLEKIVFIQGQKNQHLNVTLLTLYGGSYSKIDLVVNGKKATLNKLFIAFNQKLNHVKLHVQYI